jgi:hypothetical protein
MSRVENVSLQLKDPNSNTCLYCLESCKNEESKVRFQIFFYSNIFKKFSTFTSVRDMRLVVVRNVFGRSTDKLTLTVGATSLTSCKYC